VYLFSRGEEEEEEEEEEEGDLLVLKTSRLVCS